MTINANVTHQEQCNNRRRIWVSPKAHSCLLGERGEERDFTTDEGRACESGTAISIYVVMVRP